MTYLAVRTAQTGANGIGVQEDVAYTLDGTQQAIAGTVTQRSGAHTGNSNPIPDNLITHTLRADGFDASEDGTGRGTPLTAQGAAVRRLTPTECLRLQGFPDDWFDGLGLSDGPKYRMCGNAVSVPVVYWILARIAALEAGRPG